MKNYIYGYYDEMNRTELNRTELNRTELNKSELEFKNQINTE
jgi:hypothetical protein